MCLSSSNCPVHAPRLRLIIINLHDLTPLIRWCPIRLRRLVMMMQLLQFPLLLRSNGPNGCILHGLIRPYAVMKVCIQIQFEGVLEVGAGQHRELLRVFLLLWQYLFCGNCCGVKCVYQLIVILCVAIHCHHFLIYFRQELFWLALWSSLLLGHRIMTYLRIDPWAVVVEFSLSRNSLDLMSAVLHEDITPLRHLLLE